MSESLSDKVVVVTGAANGIGFEIADKFLNHKAKNIILLDVSEEQGVEAAKVLNDRYGKNKAIFIKCDVTKDLNEVSENIFELYKTVDVLVNNAGIINESQISKTIDINVNAVLQWCMKFYEHMRKDKNGSGGTIINISSMWGCYISNYAPTYQASKFAVCGFTKSLGHMNNYIKTGVRVVGVCPGFTDTNLTADIKPWDPILNDEFKEFLKQQVWQKSNAVGKATVDVFLIAESGTTWKIDGAKPITEV